MVFNPLPWDRDGVASLDVGGSGFAGLPTGALGLPGGKDDLPPSFACDGQRMRLEVRRIPGLGYQTLVPRGPRVESLDRPELNVAEARFELSDRIVNFDPARGTVRSVVDPKVGEWIGASSPFGFGQILYERFDSNNVAAYVKSYVKISADWAVNELGKPVMLPAATAPYRAASPASFTLRYTNSPVAAEAVMEAPPSAQVPFGVTTRYVFYKGQRYFDIELTIHNKPADPWPEAAWLCLPFNVDSPQFRLGRQGSIVDPAKDLVPGANQNLYAVDTGLALFDAAGRGAGVCALDSPLVSLDEPGCWKYSRDFVPAKPVVFINLFNNQWTTNFRMWNQGTWTARVRIWCFDRFDPERDLVRPSLEARYPLQAICVAGKGGHLPVSAAGLAVSREINEPNPRAPWRGSRGNVLVTAFGPNPDGPGTLLRLWELAGKTESCLVLLPAGLKVKSVQPVDLRGRPNGAALPVKDNSFETPLRGFAPASFVMGQ